MARIYQISFPTLSAASAPCAIDGFVQSHSKASVIMWNSRTALEYRCPDGSKGTVGLKSIALRNEEFMADMKSCRRKSLDDARADALYTYPTFLLQHALLEMPLWKRCSDA